MTDAVSKERTRNYLRQIKASASYKAIAVAASFFTIPLTINYLGPERFGIWSTLLTVISWVVFFDFGIGNGLRNKVAELLAKGDNFEARHYIASGYTIIGVIAFLLWTLSMVGSYFVPWQIVFNSRTISEFTLRSTFQIATSFILSNFWIGLIGALLGATQRTSMVAFGQMLSNLLVLGFVFILSKTTEKSISNLAFVYGFSLLAANIFLSLWFYQNHTDLRPYACLNKRHISPLLSVGFQFFVIQLAVLVIFTTDKMLITQLFGPEYVTQYEVVFKFFSVITFAHALISAPLWSAYTDAYHKDDVPWIKRMLRKQLALYIGVIAVVLLLSLIAKPAIEVWIGSEIYIQWELILSMGVLILVSTWNNVYTMITNGIGQIKPQLYTATIAMVVNIPLSVYFAKFTELGISGITVGTICSLLFSAVILPLQVHKTLSTRKSKG